VFEYSQVAVPFSHLSADRITGDDEDLLAACRVLEIRLQEPPPPARLGAVDSAEPQWWRP
jgi:hypothetical protein